MWLECAAAAICLQQLQEQCVPASQVDVHKGTVVHCLQSRERLKRRVQQLMTSREELRLAAAYRMQASKVKADLVRAADLQVGFTLPPCHICVYAVSQP